MKQVPLWVVKAAEVHGHAQAHALRGDVFDLLLFSRRGVGLACQGATCTTHSQQVTREVAAVNGGDIGRLQNFQCFGLVPVVQMPVVFGHSFHGAKSCLQPVNHILSADPAELASACHRKQVQAYVGGRCTVCQCGFSVNLQIVRRQVVVKRADAVFKKSPGISCNIRQVSALLSTQPLRFGLWCWQADPPRKNRSQRPQHEQCCCLWIWIVQQRQHNQHNTGQRCENLPA